MSYLPADSILTMLSELAGIRRPTLLLRTARHGTLDYNREAELKRILRLPATPAPSSQTLARLLELEAQHNDCRIRPPHEAGNPWRAAQHVEVLIALIAEARLLASAVPR